MDVILLMIEREPAACAVLAALTVLCGALIAWLMAMLFALPAELEEEFEEE